MYIDTVVINVSFAWRQREANTKQNGVTRPIFSSFLIILHFCSIYPMISCDISISLPSDVRVSQLLRRRRGSADFPR